jgi:hypothetical protein
MRKGLPQAHERRFVSGRSHRDYQSDEISAMGN